jgi:hypothetical protein
MTLQERNLISHDGSGLSRRNLLIRAAAAGAVCIAGAPPALAGTCGGTLAFPGAVGFGRFSVGGRGGQVIKVTNLNDSGTGSLRAALTAAGPRIVVFEVGGWITLTSDINIEHPYLTVAGQSAPSPGIHIRGAGVDIRTHNVIIRHVGFRNGTSNDSDSLGISDQGGQPHDIIIDHCTIQWGLDENLSITRQNVPGSIGPQRVTIMNCIIAENLGSGNCLITTAKDVTLYRNILAFDYDRNPLAKAYGSKFGTNVFASCESVNNLYYGSKRRITMGEDDDATGPSPCYLSVVNNFMPLAPGGWALGSAPVVTVLSGNWAPGSKLYGFGNIWEGSGAFRGGSQTYDISVIAPPVSSNISGADLMPAGLALQASLIDGCGARPKDRDNQILGLLNKITSRATMSFKPTTVAGFGGFPTLLNTSRAYDVPSNYSSIGSDSYSVIEESLNAEAAALATGS